LNETADQKTAQPIVPVARSRKRVLLYGYAALIALLVFASFEAYRIQESASTHHIDLVRRYSQQDEAMSALRNAIFVAGTRVRDFFIDTRPETAARLRQYLLELRADTERSLKTLERLKALPDHATLQTIDEFWEAIRPVPDEMLRASATEKYAFVEQEVSPRRSALHAALRALIVSGQNEMQRREAEITQSRQQAGQRLILVLGLCGVLALAVVRFSVVHSDALERASERQYEALAQARQELQELSARLVEIEEELRKRLARELHDEIGQSLAILQIEISNLLTLSQDRMGDARGKLIRARELAEKSVQAIRGMSLLLRPPLLDDLGLVPALEWLLEDFMRRSGVPCEFKAHLADDQFPDPVKTCVYRVVQEAVLNCEKHAAPGRVKVTIGQSGGEVWAEVEDNGRGFKVEATVAPSRQRGLGIVGMRERATRLGGTLTIDSAPGKGSRLRLSVPIQQTESRGDDVAVQTRS
jgi:signal transduction histidine kinase